MNEFAMHDAARDGNLVRLRQLIEAGVPVDSLNETGQTPLHRAARFGQYEVAELLINSKCDLDIMDRSGLTPVMWAAEWGRKNIVYHLLRRGAQVNCFDEDWRTLLHKVSLNGWTDIVRLILDNGEADLNAVTRDGSTPLMVAVKHGQYEIAALLIRAGADVNISTKIKTTVLHMAVQKKHIIVILPPDEPYGLGRVESRHSRVIQILLEKEGLDLNPQDVHGNTPLHFACHIKNREAIKQLLDAGADANLKNSKGETALSEGIKRRNLTHEEIRLFVQKGAFLENCDYKCISQNNVLKRSVLKDFELCTQSVVNKFNRQSLPALNSIAYFARRLPNVDNFKLGARHIDEVENLVKCEIEKNAFCNVVKVHPIALSALCVLSLLTCQSGKKRAASSDFGQSPLKKKS